MTLILNLGRTSRPLHVDMSRRSTFLYKPVYTFLYIKILDNVRKLTNSVME